MGEHLHKEFGAEIDLIAGGGGIFVVAVDGREIFAKSKEGRFPDFNEITTVVKGIV